MGILVTRSSGLANTNLQGIVPRRRKRGSDTKRFEDNTIEWSGLSFADTILRTERKLTDKFTVLPRQSPQLYDK